MPRSDRTIQIGLGIDLGLSFCREVLCGVRDYACLKSNWRFVHLPPSPAGISSGRARQCDGFVSFVFGPAMSRKFERLRRPVVNVASIMPQLPFPRVCADHEAVGVLAAEHFLDRGYQRMAFAGYGQHEFSMRREAGFRRRLAAASIEPASSFHERRAPRTHPSPLEAHGPQLKSWLTTLERPIAIFAANDVMGFHLSEMVRELGFGVPDEVALLGVDNDDLLCALARPSLSSVALPTKRMGYEAAALLDRLLEGAAEPREIITLPPVGIVTRESSDALAIEDRAVAAALRVLRDRSHERLRVRDLVRAAGTSRRRLERRFRLVLGRGLGEELIRVRLASAQRLLAETDLPMSIVAERAGFTDSRHLSVTVRRVCGTTPSEYRQRHRLVPSV